TITRGTNNDNISGFNYFHGSSKEGDNIKVDNIANTMQGGFSIVLTHNGTNTPTLTTPDLTALDFSNVNDASSHIYEFTLAPATTNNAVVSITEYGDPSKFYGQAYGWNALYLTKGNDVVVPYLHLNRNNSVAVVDAGYGVNTLDLSTGVIPNGNDGVFAQVGSTLGLDGVTVTNIITDSTNDRYQNFTVIKYADGGKFFWDTWATYTDNVGHSYTLQRASDNPTDNIALCGYSNNYSYGLNMLLTGNQEVFTSNDINSHTGKTGNLTFIGEDFAVNQVGYQNVNGSGVPQGRNYGFGTVNITIGSYLDMSGLHGTHEDIKINKMNGGVINVDMALQANYVYDAAASDSKHIVLTQGSNSITLVAGDDNNRGGASTSFNVHQLTMFMGSDDSSTHGLSATDYQNFSQTAVTWDNGNDYLNNLNNKTNSTDFWSNFDKQLNDQANAKGNNTNSSSNGNNTSGNAVQHSNNAFAKPAGDNDSAGNKNSSSEHHNDNNASNNTIINHSHDEAKADTNTNSAHAIKEVNAESNSNQNTTVNHKHSDINHDNSSNNVDLHAILNAAKNSVNQDGGNHIYSTSSSFSSVMSTEVVHIMQSTYQNDETNSMSYTLSSSVYYDSNSDGNNMVNHTHKENKDHHNH
ncbi:hypothetical protein ACFX5K_05665, partial [Rickettsiales bacterium LUAb2]